ncbi:MAG: HIT domain-containing protein [Phycisphaerales bacterium]|nr:HIT domain-containing protein [Phycisphaerales bacterium]
MPLNSSDPTGPDSLWAPWRLTYLESLDEEDAAPLAPPPGVPAPACFLSDYFAHPEDDRKNHVVVRTDTGLILLNRFPYANGHLLVALGEGRPRLLDYEPHRRAQLWSLAETAMDLMERTLRCQGVNMGINQGRAAGAGVPQHLHVHLVPRWAGDVNFMSTVGKVRVIPSSLEAMAERYRRTWVKMQSR